MSKQDTKDTLNKDLANGLASFTLAAERVLNISLSLHLNKADLFRILNIISWSERNHISLEELLKVLLPIWRNKFKSASKGLGVRISLLGGPKSKEIIKTYIKKSYPNGENIKLAKQLAKDKFLPEIKLTDVSSPLDYVVNYKSNILAIREEDKKMTKIMQRRLWRGNPFI